MKQSYLYDYYIQFNLSRVNGNFLLDKSLDWGGEDQTMMLKK